jgi:hypothetical protein
MSHYKQCFIKLSMRLMHSDGKKWFDDESKDDADSEETAQVMRCYNELRACRKTTICTGDSGTVQCAIDWGWGAGDAWCVRKDVQTVSMCEGDYPNNYKCKDKTCLIGNCVEQCGARPTQFRPTPD